MKVDNIGLGNTYQTQTQTQSETVNTDDFKKKLEAAAKSKDESEIKEVCKQFESIFVNMLFKEMRKTVQEGGLTEKSNARETFEGMLDEEMSKKITEAGGIGLADMMVKNFMNRYDQAEAPAETDEDDKISLDLKG